MNSWRTRTRRRRSSIPRSPRTASAASRWSGRATTRTAPTSASSASGSVPPGRSSARSFGSTLTRPGFRPRRPWRPRPAMDSWSSGERWPGRVELRIFGQRFDDTGAKVGDEFPVNASRSLQRRGVVAMDRSGNFVVVSSQYTSLNYAAFVVSDLMGQRFDASGAPAGSEFMVAPFKSYFDFESIISRLPRRPRRRRDPGRRLHRRLGRLARGHFPKAPAPRQLTIKGSSAQTLLDDGRQARHGVFRIALVHGGRPVNPRRLRSDPLGNLVVVWSTQFGQDGSNARGIRGQRFDGSGEKVGPDSRSIRTRPGTRPRRRSRSTRREISSSSGSARPGWILLRASSARASTDTGTASADRVPAQRVHDGRPAGAADRERRPRIRRRLGERGSRTADGFGVFGRRQHLHAESLTVDAAAKTGTSSDRNGVLEPGETVVVEPRWSNVTCRRDRGDRHGDPARLHDRIRLRRSGGRRRPATGSIAAGGSAVCNDGSPDACYQVSASGPRPGDPLGRRVHRESLGRRRPLLDAARRRQLLGRAALAALLQEDRDVAPHGNHVRLRRDAILSERGRLARPDGDLHRQGHRRPGRARADDGAGRRELVQLLPRRFIALHRRRADRRVLQARPLPRRAERDRRLQRESVLSGPDRDARRDGLVHRQGRRRSGRRRRRADDAIRTPTTSRSYSCVSGSANLHFTDVLVSNPFCKHIHYLWAKGIVDGCSATKYCPSAPVARDAMAKFLSNGFGLSLYGP